MEYLTAGTAPAPGPPGLTLTLLLSTVSTMDRFGTPVTMALTLLVCKWPMKCHWISAGSCGALSSISCTEPAHRVTLSNTLIACCWSVWSATGVDAGAARVHHLGIEVALVFVA